MLSSTVTIALQVLVFPASSVTVNTTGFAPRLVQLNEDTLIEKLAIPQLSVLPLSI